MVTFPNNYYKKGISYEDFKEALQKDVLLRIAVEKELLEMAEADVKHVPFTTKDFVHYVMMPAYNLFFKIHILYHRKGENLKKVIQDIQLFQDEFSAYFDQKFVSEGDELECIGYVADMIHPKNGVRYRHFVDGQFPLFSKN
jgi:hypothetical protein